MKGHDQVFLDSQYVLPSQIPSYASKQFSNESIHWKWLGFNDVIIGKAESTHGSRCLVSVVLLRDVTFALSTDDESESGGCCWLRPGVSPPGDAVQLDDESNSVLESGCMFSS